MVTSACGPATPATVHVGIDPVAEGPAVFPIDENGGWFTWPNNPGEVAADGTGALWFTTSHSIYHEVIAHDH